MHLLRYTLRFGNGESRRGSQQHDRVAAVISIKLAFWVVRARRDEGDSAIGCAQVGVTVTMGKSQTGRVRVGFEKGVSDDGGNGGSVTIASRGMSFMMTTRQAYTTPSHFLLITSAGNKII